MRHWLPSLWNEPREGSRFTQLRSEFDRMFDDFLRSDRALTADGREMLSAPRMDVAESEDGLEVSVELPGIDEKDVDVTVEDDVLLIKGEKKSEAEEKQKDYHLVERRYGSFRRSLRLPRGIDPDKVSATFEKGVLKVTLPKPESAKANRRRIEVKSA